MERPRFGVFWIHTVNVISIVIMILSLIHVIGGGIVIQKMKNDYDYNYRRPPDYNVTIEDQKSDLNFRIYTYNVVMVVFSGVWLFGGSCFYCMTTHCLPFHGDEKPEEALIACVCLFFIEPLIGVIYGAIIFSTAQQIVGTQYTLFICTFISYIVLVGLSCFPICIECLIGTTNDCRSSLPPINDQSHEQKSIEIAQPSTQNLSTIVTVSNQNNNNLIISSVPVYEHSSRSTCDLEQWHDLKSIIPRKY